MMTPVLHPTRGQLVEAKVLIYANDIHELTDHEFDSHILVRATHVGQSLYCWVRKSWVAQQLQW
jgi:hypothetical protein